MFLGQALLREGDSFPDHIVCSNLIRSSYQKKSPRHRFLLRFAVVLDSEERRNGALKITEKNRTMNTEIQTADGTTTLLTTLKLDPKDKEKVLDLLKQSTESTICKLSGWISTNFLVGLDSSRIVIYSQWKTLEDIRAMQSHRSLVPYFQQILTLATIDGFPATVSYSHHA